MYDYQMFRTVRMKGFDRDEVIAYIQSKDEEFSRKMADLEKTIGEKDRMIEELKSRLMQKDAQRVALENEIETKYKKYIENYDKIGALVYESQVKGDQMVADAKIQADKLVGDATREANRLVGDATARANQLVGDARTEADTMVGNASEEAARIRSKANEEARTTRAAAVAEVEKELAEGKQKYSQIQAILNDTVELINQVQKRFMSSYKDVHELVAEVPSEKELAKQVDRSGPEADEFDDIPEEGAGFETGELNFDLSEALLDSEDEELDEIPEAYREAAEAAAEGAVGEAYAAAGEAAEAVSAAAAAGEAAEAVSAAEEAASTVAEGAAFQPVRSITEDLTEAAKAVAEPLAPEIKPLEDEAEAYFRGASV